MERVSEFMDGELNVDAVEHEIARLKSDVAAREVWDTYHVIRDAMRGDVPAMPGFTSRFSARLAAEPTVLAPHTRAPRVSRKLQTYALSAAASAAAVAVVGWMGYGVMKAEAPPAQIAKAPAAIVQPVAQPTVQAASALPVSVPAEHVHEYMLAHSGISPTTQIQGVTTYIRTVSASDE